MTGEPARWTRPETVETVLDIEGRVYRIEDGDGNALAAASGLAARLSTLDLDALGAGAYQALCDEIAAAVDGALGEGACAEIFAGRRVNVVHLIDLLAFVVTHARGGFDAAVRRTLDRLAVTGGEDGEE